VGAPRDLGVVLGENLVRNRRCRFDLRKTGIASRFTALANLRGEDDISRESLAAARAGRLGEHGQTDGDPENADDRESRNGREETGVRTRRRAWRTNTSWTIDVRVPQESLLWPPQASDGR
jgi:hypothetical protein